MNNIKEAKQIFLNDIINMIDFYKLLIDIETEEDEEKRDKKFDRIEERYDELKNIKSFV